MSDLTKFIRYFFLYFLTIVFAGNKIYSQGLEFRKTSITTGVGIGFNGGSKEDGVGLIYSVGWQKSFGKKNKLRVNPHMMTGGFWPFGISDTRDQFYRITTLGLNFHYDLIKYKALSVVATVGAFGNYSRGLLGTGGWPEANHNRSEYFHSLYFGNNMSLGLRINSEKAELL